MYLYFNASKIINLAILYMLKAIGHIMTGDVTRMSGKLNCK